MSNERETTQWAELCDELDDEVEELRDRVGILTTALALAVTVADEARNEWDAAPSGMKAGKLLIALSGNLPGYRADIDTIHAALALPQPPSTGDTQ